MTFAELCLAIHTNDFDKIVHLHRQLLPNLIAYARRNGGNDEDAKDALQEALIKFYVKVCLPCVSEGACSNDNCLGYVFTIAKNALIDILKKRAAYKMQPIDTMLERKNSNNTKVKEAAYKMQPIDTMLDVFIAFLANAYPGEEVNLNTFKKLLLSAIGSLKNKTGIQHFQFRLEGLSYKEIDAKMGYKPGTARQHQHRYESPLKEIIVNMPEIKNYPDLYDFIKKYQIEVTLWKVKKPTRI
ncbi:sigma-70 family RNA polymerase sigma factor [Sphingobacteriales bacterium UPWRP_1]|nr:hypothetical protein BVG80_07375 [Sphingobacteriales bacterium TSM_CSM]PSJ78249.1 sigma-70 family RNA polymerase sigma factor [Sphingobacteriales bacterium UPWRP_1]